MQSTSSGENADKKTLQSTCMKTTAKKEAFDFLKIVCNGLVFHSRLFGVISKGIIQSWGTV